VEEVEGLPLRTLDGAVRIAKLDLAPETDIIALTRDLQDLPIDLLICNGATFGGTRSRLESLDFDAWRAALEVNLIGTIRVATGLLTNVARSDERKIVFLGSRAGLPREARPNMSYIYASSKAALNAAARCFALDLRNRGVVVALLNPGHVQTGIGGAGAPMRTGESVSKMRHVIAELTIEQTGRFWHYDGTELPL